MQNLRLTKITPDSVRVQAWSYMHVPLRAITLCALSMLFIIGVAAQLQPAPQQKQSQDDKQSPSPFDKDEDDESESESKQTARARVTDPATILRKAHFIRVHSDSVFVSEQEVEDSLRKRKEFQAWGMVITRNDSEADLFIEITRKSLTRRFTFTVIDPNTMEVVASGKTRSVLFGKKISNKVAEKFANRVKVVRPYPPVSNSTP